MLHSPLYNFSHIDIDHIKEINVYRGVSLAAIRMVKWWKWENAQEKKWQHNRTISPNGSYSFVVAVPWCFPKGHVEHAAKRWKKRCLRGSDMVQWWPMSSQWCLKIKLWCLNHLPFLENVAHIRCCRYAGQWCRLYCRDECKLQDQAWIQSNLNYWNTKYV